MNLNRRDELKGKQTKGNWEVDPNNFRIESSEINPKSILKDREIIVFEGCGCSGSPLNDETGEADAYLIAEAGTVANRTGMWPKDMEDYIEKLESILESYMYKDTNP